MADFERRADFAEGTVDGSSFEARPDAIVPLLANAPGPVALGDTSSGQLRKGWYVRVAANGSTVLLGESQDDGSAWKAEVEIFEVDGTATTISLAFDVSARPIVAVEVGTEVWVYEWTGAAFERTTVLADSLSPALVLRSPNGAFAEPFLFYERGDQVYYRAGSESWGTEYGPVHQLANGQRLWRAILGSEDRVHLIFSTRNEGEGTYSLQRRTSGPFSAGCLETTGHSERIDDGVESLVVWRGDGEIRTSCIVECEVLIIAAGGNAGDFGSGERSVLWMDENGFGLDPDSDPVPAIHHAFGGGHGRDNDRNGSGGGSGGGGGGASPSNNSMWTAGGGGVAGQGHAGGGGRSSWGILPRKVAGSGGGGGYGGPGGGGTGGNPGEPGPGELIPGWNWAGPRGGRGFSVVVVGESTGGVHGGGGAGGVIVRSGVVIPAGETIRVEVGQGASGGAAGQGGDAQGGLGITGMIVLRIRRLALDELPHAVLSGGTEFETGPWRYHTFEADGPLSVVEPGRAEIVAVGGGGGGGSGVGGGGGGGDVRIVQAYIAEDEDVVVGEGGAGGTAGGNGADGEDSSVGDHVTAQGGGGGAGAPPTGVAGSRATGGGGHGDGGAPGGGTALRGYQGGPGGGYELSAGGEAYHAGGGGGAGGDGEIGATQEETSSPFEDDWDIPAEFLVVPDTSGFNDFKPYLRLITDNSRAMLRKSVARDRFLCQIWGFSSNDHSYVGPGVRMNYTTPGDETTAPLGYFAVAHRDTSQFRLRGGGISLNVASGFNLGQVSGYNIQLFVEDSLQQAAFEGVDQSTVARRRLAATDATYDGVAGSAGPFGANEPISGDGRGGFREFLAFADRYLYVGNMPTGGKAQVLREDGTVVNEATESSGEAAIDLSMYQDGSDDSVERVPYDGWSAIRVLDSLDEVVAEVSGAIYPGGEYEVDGAEIVVLVDPGDSATEPFPIDGLLFKSRWDELSPGPFAGNGGPGVGEAEEPDVEPEDQSPLIGIRGESWRLNTGLSEYLGGGGGAAGELFTRGEGGIGGGGDGGIDSPAHITPTAGVDGTGGGGGGSARSADAGGAGGRGIVVLRTFDPSWEPPPGPPEAGLYGWWAADSLEYANGETVAVWPDLGPNGYDMTAGGDPSLLTGDINGLPSVVYDGNDTHTRPSMPPPGLVGVTAWYVYRRVGGSNISVAAWNPGSFSNRFETHDPANDDLFFDHGNPTGAGRLTVDEPTGFDNNWWLLERHKTDSSGGLAYIAANGVVLVSGTMNDPIDDALAEFAFCKGITSTMRLAEVIIYSTPQSEADRNATREYLANKYGFSLP